MHWLRSSYEEYVEAKSIYLLQKSVYSQGLFKSLLLAILCRLMMASHSLEPARSSEACYEVKLIYRLEQDGRGLFECSSDRGRR